ncbi:hypothetical protein ASG42_24475 [Rhizobium sp. Leaf391]|uniref:hypothetical protein n=1 Tax=Rhizobium sp. Leaf391 TaxID=1736360 RepID=UPI000713162D|nr:hypothetical protein [Rhizobium sp. Leaf391]KQT03170.1 hypothetical protein ASG42_24475 [Rhizobium sp. Leaf391]
MTVGLEYRAPEEHEVPFFQKKCQHSSRESISDSALQSLRDRVIGPDGFDHFDVLQVNTGWEIDIDKWAKRRVAADRLNRQTEEMADALERMGERARRPSDLSIIGAVSERVEELPVYRAIRILPTVAARDRRKYLNSLKYMIANNRDSQYYRYAVFTSGDLIVEGGALREAIQALSRRISRWSSWARGKYDIEVLFRGIEFTRASAQARDHEAAERYREEHPDFFGDLGTPLSDRYGKDTILYHLHANVLFWPHRKLDDDAWTSFLKGTHSRAKGLWKDTGVIQKAEELVKYCFKPNELKAAPDEAILWLFHETKELKMCQPMGRFAEFLHELSQKREKIVGVNVMGRVKYCRVKKTRRARQPVDAQNVGRHETTPVDGSPETRCEASPKPQNIVLGVTLPQWRHMPYAEPMILVQRYKPDATSNEDQQRFRQIEALKSQARQDWELAQAPNVGDALKAADRALASQVARANEDAYKVHRCRSTVLDMDQIPHQEPGENIFEGSKTATELEATAPILGKEPQVPRKDRAAVILLAAEAFRKSVCHGATRHVRALAAHYSASYPEIEAITDAELLASANSASEWIRQIEIIMPGRWLSDEEIAVLRPRIAA